VPDPRLDEYARLLVERSVGVQPGWQVDVHSTIHARPLVEAVVLAIARRGAYALVRLGFSDLVDATWPGEAPEELLDKPAPIALHEQETVDASISIMAPENTRTLSGVDGERLKRFRKGREPLFRRARANLLPWVICEFPTPAAAQDAGMSTHEYAEFVYGSVLLDWDAELGKMERIRERFDRAETVRLVGDATDLRLGLAGRSGLIDDGHLNMPGGEIYYGPVEDATEGVITYSEFPAVFLGHEVTNARLVFEHGRVTDASASTGEDFLLETLDTDEGARVVGELGIGCNPGITRFMKNTLFDEKIYGTVHLALGNSYPATGGTNESALHWDMVKDLRSDGQIYCDDELVQENGEWLF
jgi:aminopeptidase